MPTISMIFSASPSWIRSRLDDPQRQLLGLESKERRSEVGTVLGVDRQPEAAALRKHEERDRMQRQDRSWRKHRPLHTLLSALGDEGPHVGELAKFSLVDAGLPSRWQRRTGLCDHESDFAGRDLHPRVFLDAVHRPHANRDSRHQQVGLIPGFAMKRDGTALAASGSPAADHQAHLVGTDAMNRQQSDEQEKNERHGDRHRRLDRRESKHGSLQMPTGLADGLEVGSPLFRVRGNTPRGAGIAPVVPP